jgi:carbon-monoxide dehydrogenase small subunit
MKRLTSLRVNGRDQEIAVSPRLTLLQVLRDELGLTGTKQGCGEGECGTCTVLLDGVPVNACLVLALEAAGRAVTTIEGVADGPRLHPLQRAFVQAGAIQCGFCTPGMILTAKALLDRNPSPTGAEIREALAGNLCRCTGYQKIVEAVQAAAATMGEGPGEGR